MRDLVAAFKANEVRILGVRGGSERYDNRTDGIPREKRKLVYATVSPTETRSPWPRSQDPDHRAVGPFRLPQPEPRVERLDLIRPQPEPPQPRDLQPEPEPEPPVINIKPKPIKYAPISVWERPLLKVMANPKMYTLFVNPVAGAMMMGCKEDEARAIFKRWSDAGVMHRVMQPNNAHKYGWITPEGRVTPMDFGE